MMISAFNVTQQSVALNHEEIGKKSHRMSEVKLFTNKHNWKGIGSYSWER